MTEITQADKSRADRWLDRPSDTPARRSERDRLASKFARHREQAEAETVAKIVAWLRENSAEICDWSPPTIAAAIIDREYKQ